MSLSVKRFYEFGPFRIDAEKRVLLRDGVPVSLAPKALDMLLVLVQHRGQALEKDQLMNLLWPESDVEEANLPQNVSALRKALGETPNDRRYIITIPGRGYRFAAQVKEWDDEGTGLVVEKYSQSTVVMEESREGLWSGASSWLQRVNRPKLKDRAVAEPAVSSRRAIRNLAALAVLVIVAATAWFYLNRKPALTEKDTVLLADFENKTGEEIFDVMLKQGLAIQLQESPFLEIFPEARVRQTLRMMGRAPNERVTAETAREICERDGLKALIAGSIAPLGSHYVISLEAINAENGEALAREQAQAENRERVLRALSQAATQLREKLGESLSSIQRSDKPLEEATTSKLEAFKLFSLGSEEAVSGRLIEAIPFLKRAVESDPNFASAYNLLSIMHGGTGRLGLAAEYSGKAYSLKDRVGEYEKLRLSSRYHLVVTGDLNKASEVLKLEKRIFPRKAPGPNDLAFAYNQIGQLDQAMAESRDSIRLNPVFAAPYRHLAWALLRLNRFAEAKDTLEPALHQNLEMTEFHSLLYQIAFITGDTTGMQQQVDWASSRPDEYVALDWQTGATAFAGQWRRAQELSRRAIELAARGDTKEVAARYAAEQALRLAAWSSTDGLPASQNHKLKPELKSLVQTALKLERGRAALPRAALALALCGETGEAKTLMAELAKRYPEDTVIHSISLPVIRSAMELQAGNAAQALEQLQTVSRYEAAAEFWPQYLGGQASLKLGQGKEAAAEFQRILEHRGQGPLSVLYSLAHLGAAQAAALAGDTAKGRKGYEDFFAAWKDADPDLPPLIAAKNSNLKAMSIP